jgi:hypothetical protein
MAYWLSSIISSASVYTVQMQLLSNSERDEQSLLRLVAVCNMLLLSSAFTQSFQQSAYLNTHAIKCLPICMRAGSEL